MPAISLTPYNIISFVSLIFSIITVILGLDCIWRVERRLDTYMKLLTTGVGVTVIIKILVLVGFKQTPNGENILFYTDLLSTILIFSSFVEMFRIIRILNNEKK